MHQPVHALVGDELALRRRTGRHGRRHVGAVTWPYHVTRLRRVGDDTMYAGSYGLRPARITLPGPAARIGVHGTVRDVDAAVEVVAVAERRLHEKPVHPNSWVTVPGHRPLERAVVLGRDAAVLEHLLDELVDERPRASSRPRGRPRASARSSALSRAICCVGGLLLLEELLGLPPRAGGAPCCADRELARAAGRGPSSPGRRGPRSSAVWSRAQIDVLRGGRRAPSGPGRSGRRGSCPARRSRAGSRPRSGRR